MPMEKCLENNHMQQHTLVNINYFFWIYERRANMHYVHVHVVNYSNTVYHTC